MTERTYTQDEVDQLVTLSVQTSRLLMARALGQTAYEGDRDYYEVLGYPTTIQTSDYVQRYERQDIASRIVDLPALDTWKSPPKISENDDEDTAFIQAWQSLAGRLKAWNVLSRADRLSGIGRFGIVLIGVRGGNDLGEPVKDQSLKSPQDILYLRPYSESRATVETWNKETSSPRYGLPETYKVQLETGRSGTIVHWTRVFHLAENKLDSETYGVPRLRPVFNLLDDLMKVVGGTAEATWLNMRPGIMVGPREEYDWEDTDDATTAWLQEVQRYAHDPLRMLRLVGMEAQQIGTSEVLDPTGPHSVVIAQIAATTGIPQRKLLGSAAGELSASREDTRQWATYISERQMNYAEPEILRPFIDRLCLYGVLPAPREGLGRYDIGTLNPDGSRSWPSIIELSEEERAQATLNQANAVKALTDPTTLELPLSVSERRELLGYPSQETLDEESSPVESPPGTVEAVIAEVVTNYHQGKITADQMAEFAMMEWLEALA